jgi:hypothetical protein
MLRLLFINAEEARSAPVVLGKIVITHSELVKKSACHLRAESMPD